MTQIKLIVALNNPGDSYANTRHNVGKWVLDALLHKYNTSLRKETKFFGEAAEITINNTRVRVLAPSTFMNLSGKSVQAFMHFYNIQPEEVLVMHDELAFKPGQIKLKFGGGHNGHNGLRDIHRFAGDQYWRLRIGIDHPGDKSQVANYVLGIPPAAERKLIQEAVDKAVRGIEDIFYIGMERTMNSFNA